MILAIRDKEHSLEKTKKGPCNRAKADTNLRAPRGTRSSKRERGREREISERTTEVEFSSNWIHPWNDCHLRGHVSMMRINSCVYGIRRRPVGKQKVDSSVRRFFKRESIRSLSLFWNRFRLCHYGLLLKKELPFGHCPFLFSRFIAMCVFKMNALGSRREEEKTGMIKAKILRDVKNELSMMKAWTWNSM